MTPNLLGDYFGQGKVSAVCKIILFCGGIDALKAINERCIATLCNMTKFSSPTTRTNLNTQIQVLQHRILKQAHKNLSTNISNMTSKLAKGETSTALILLQSLKCRLGNIPCRKCLTGKCFVPNWSYCTRYSMSTEKKPYQRGVNMLGVFSVDFEQDHDFLVPNI